ncbi:hypothetical protein YASMINEVIRUS_162 [Yasminevirus sp. GU-2018]|uniref:Uncharacterized protein n=1 Tax=Yasminevirus sp. GU-2018 TaxID=2420051 RepID=A0A5K0U6X9_9VIRU|nr:hypothetical protein YASMINEVIRUS_162 [Yasminevirus sp. GU-2018]
MSKHQTAYDYCKCRWCDIVRHNSEQNVWLHVGTGNTDDEKFASLASGTVLKDNFSELGKSSRGGFQIGTKPRGALWFSHGSWSVDPYCDGDHLTRTRTEKKTTHKLLYIQNPKNILVIRDQKSLDKFIEDYTIVGPDNQTDLRKERITALKDDFMYKTMVKAGKLDVVRARTKESLTERGGDYELVVNFIREHCSDVKSNCRNFARKFMKAHPQYEKILGKDEKDLTEAEKWDVEIHGHSHGTIVLEQLFEVVFIAILIDELEKVPDVMERKYGKIDWDMVWNKGDGYWGVAFEFRKVKHIGLDDFDPKYYWHIGWDSESLCILDLRAFDNTVTVKDIEM